MCISNNYIFFFLLGPVVEGKFFPVVDNVRIINVDQHKAYTEITFSADKVRACSFAEVAGLSYSDGEYKKAFVDFGEKQAPSSRALGEQVFGPWKIYPAGSTIILSAYNVCHSLWETSTPLIYWTK